MVVFERHLQTRNVSRQTAQDLIALGSHFFGSKLKSNHRCIARRVELDRLLLNRFLTEPFQAHIDPFGLKASMANRRDDRDRRGLKIASLNTHALNPQIPLRIPLCRYQHRKNRNTLEGTSLCFEILDPIGASAIGNDHNARWRFVRITLLETHQCTFNVGLVLVTIPLTQLFHRLNLTTKKVLL